jgi:hypothetical protein
MRLHVRIGCRAANPVRAARRPVPPGRDLPRASCHCYETGSRRPPREPAKRCRGTDVVGEAPCRPPCRHPGVLNHIGMNRIESAMSRQRTNDDPRAALEPGNGPRNEQHHGEGLDDHRPHRLTARFQSRMAWGSSLRLRESGSEPHSVYDIANRLSRRLCRGPVGNDSLVRVRHEAMAAVR